MSMLKRLPPVFSQVVMEIVLLEGDRRDIFEQLAYVSGGCFV